MRVGPPSEVLADIAGWACEVSSWLDGRCLAQTVPVTTGKLSMVASQAVPEQLTFTVPAVDDDGVSWVPGADPTHPLAKYGQQVTATIVVTSSVTGQSYRTPLGWYCIHDWSHDDVGGTVSVTALGQLQRVATDRFETPEAPRPASTLFSEFRRLMSPGISVSIDPTLIDRACPNTFQWAQERIGALYEIADAIPARIRTDQWGGVQLLAPLPAVPVPVLYLTDGEGGTVISAPTSDTREGLPNVVVATSSASSAADAPPVSRVARVETGPLAVTTDGSGYGRVVEHFSSPLIQTDGQALATARAVLADRSRAAVIRTIYRAPDPRTTLDDALVVTKDGIQDWGYVVACELPLTVVDGAMREDIGVVH